MSEPGYIKFLCEHVPRELSTFDGFEELKAARRKLRERRLVGLDEHGIAFGNLSVRSRTASNEFYITGSGTGGKEDLELDDFAQATHFDFSRNWVRCEGQTIASAESLTHAAVYVADGAARAVIHAHSEKIWREFRGVLPTTKPEAEYGTPAMAFEVQRLFASGNLGRVKMFIMGGHENGVVAFGSRVDEALEVLLRSA